MKRIFAAVMVSLACMASASIAESSTGPEDRGMICRVYQPTYQKTFDGALYISSGGEINMAMVYCYRWLEQNACQHVAEGAQRQSCLQEEKSRCELKYCKKIN
jgi:hypothetical protein